MACLHADIEAKACTAIDPCGAIEKGKIVDPAKTAKSEPLFMALADTSAVRIEMGTHGQTFFLSHILPWKA
jgi:hypothetical protein